MNKILLFLGLITLSLTSFAKSLGWEATNEEIDAYIKDVINVEIAEGKMVGFYKYFLIPRLEVQKELNNGNCKTFEDLCRIADEKVDAVPNAKTNLTTNYNNKTDIKKQVCLCKSIFKDEILKFAFLNPSPYDIHLARNLEKSNNLTNAEYYKFLLNTLMNYGQNDVKNSQLILDKFIDFANSDEFTTQKSDLQKLNRKFTKLLVKDKEKWEPIVALIRSTIETY